MATTINQSTPEKHVCPAGRRASFRSSFVCPQCNTRPVAHTICSTMDGHRTYVQVCTLCRSLHLPAFRDWLAARRTSSVGVPATNFNCPLARFLTETTGTAYQVEANYAHPTSAPTQQRSLPEWAALFVRSLDFTYPLDAITGAQALAVLSLVEGEKQRNTHEKNVPSTPETAYASYAPRGPNFPAVLSGLRVLPCPSAAPESQPLFGLFS
jgi:hypothetical protein